MCSEPDLTNSSPIQARHPYHFVCIDGNRYFSIGTTRPAWNHRKNYLGQLTPETCTTSPFDELCACASPKYYASESWLSDLSCTHNTIAEWPALVGVPPFEHGLTVPILDALTDTHTLSTGSSGLCGAPVLRTCLPCVGILQLERCYDEQKRT
jgi:hypothetical protein